MKIRMTAIAGITSLLLLFFSCSSLPLPGTPTESLFVLCGELEKDLGTNQDGYGNTLESLRLTIVNLDTGKEKDMVFYPSKSYVSTTLEPGKYSLNNKVSLTIRAKRGNWSETRNEYIQVRPFLIEKNTIFVSPIIVKVMDNRGWYSFTSYYSASTSNTLKKKSMDNMLGERRYKAWELYQLIGWEILEE